MILFQEHSGSPTIPPASAYREYLVKVEPRLQGGSLHRLRVTQEAVEISTLPSWYGNKLSTTLQVIPHSRIIDVRYHHTFLKTRCLVRYAAALGQPETIQLAIIHTDYSEVRSKLTQDLVLWLEVLRAGGALPAEPISFIEPLPSGRIKLIYGLLLIAFPNLLQIAVLGSFDIGVFSIFGTFFGFIVLGAVGIDYIRLQTGWHPLLKIAGSILVFCAAFIGIITVIAFVENLR